MSDIALLMASDKEWTLGRPFVVALTNGEIMTLLMACGHMLAGNPPGDIPELLRSAAAQLAEACDRARGE
jgi:hypothetical protein